MGRFQVLVFYFFLFFFTDETNLPVDTPSYLSSQGTLAERQDGYILSENGSHHFISSSMSGYFLQQRDANGRIYANVFILFPLFY